MNLVKGQTYKLVNSDGDYWYFVFDKINGNLENGETVTIGCTERAYFDKNGSLKSVQRDCNLCFHKRTDVVTDISGNTVTVFRVVEAGKVYRYNCKYSGYKQSFIFVKEVFKDGAIGGTFLLQHMNGNWSTVENPRFGNQFVDKFDPAAFSWYLEEI